MYVCYCLQDEYDVNALKNISFGYRMQKLQGFEVCNCRRPKTNINVMCLGGVHPYNQYLSNLQDI